MIDNSWNMNRKYFQNVHVYRYKCTFDMTRHTVLHTILYTMSTIGIVLFMSESAVITLGCTSRNICTKSYHLGPFRFRAVGSAFCWATNFDFPFSVSLIKYTQNQWKRNTCIFDIFPRSTCHSKLCFHRTIVLYIFYQKIIIFVVWLTRLIFHGISLNAWLAYLNIACPSEKSLYKRTTIWHIVKTV